MLDSLKVLLLDAKAFGKIPAESPRCLRLVNTFVRADLLIREETVFTKQPEKVKRNLFGPHLKPDLLGAFGGGVSLPPPVGEAGSSPDQISRRQSPWHLSDMQGQRQRRRCRRL